jgi:hypothetical protein
MRESIKVGLPHFQVQYMPALPFELLGAGEHRVSAFFFQIDDTVRERHGGSTYNLGKTIDCWDWYLPFLSA